MPRSHVYLVRHAKAEKESGSGDVGRRLTRGGRERFDLLTTSLASRLRVSRILTSPFVRARETAEILARATGAPVEDDDALSSGHCSGRKLLELARRAGPGVALVGHNPEIAEAIGLAAGRQEKVRPGTVAAIDLGQGGAVLAWIEAPPGE